MALGEVHFRVFLAWNREKRLILQCLMPTAQPPICMCNTGLSKSKSQVKFLGLQYGRESRLCLCHEEVPSSQFDPCCFTPLTPEYFSFLFPYTCNVEGKVTGCYHESSPVQKQGKTQGIWWGSHSVARVMGVTPQGS